MALYVDEEEVWKCPKHPSKRRRTGICHVCLRDRLSSLCPDCANVRPCACYASTSSSSGSSSFSFARFSSSSSSRIGSVGRVSSLIESEPSLRRSRSVAISFLRSKPSVDQDCTNGTKQPGTAAAPSFWTMFKSSSSNKSKRQESSLSGAVFGEDDNLNNNKKKQDAEAEEEVERRRMMRKSRSVAVSSDSRVADVRSSKGWGWHFPSPIKAFRQSISRGILHERSPLYRG